MRATPGPDPLRGGREGGARGDVGGRGGVGGRSGGAETPERGRRGRRGGNLRAEGGEGERVKRRVAERRGATREEVSRIASLATEGTGPGGGGHAPGA